MPARWTNLALLSAGLAAVHWALFGPEYGPFFQYLGLDRHPESFPG
jgi:hypothetical protein